MRSRISAELKPQPCDSSPCMNNGICSNEGKTFHCKCTENYEGKTCKGLLNSTKVFCYYNSHGVDC